MKGLRLREWRFEWAVWALIVAYIAFFGTLTVLKHNAFLTTAFDLGNVDQAVWNTRHGRPFAMTNIEGLASRLGTHFEPVLLPISLLYILWSDPRTLLILQTTVIALGAWPVFLITRQPLDSRQPGAGKDTPRAGRENELLAVMFALAYLLFPALQSANVFDFHAVSLAPTFFLFAFYCLERQRWGSFAVLALLTMSCKEDMPLLVAMLGLYALLVLRQWRVGLLTIVAAATWFLLAVGWIMPHFDTRGVSPLANRYAYLGDGPLEMVATLVTQPGVVLNHLFTAENGAYLRDLLTPMAFLSVLAPEVLLLALPSLAVNLLSTEGFMHQLEGFHYGVTLVPVVVIAAAHGAARLSSFLRVRLARRLPHFRSLPVVFAAVVLAASLSYHYSRGYTPFASSFRGSWPSVTSHHRLGQEMARSIPGEASLAALPHPNPHASQRQQLTMIDRVENGLPAPLHGAEFIWLDATDSWPLHPNDLKESVDNLLAGDYGLEQAVDGWILLRRGAPAKTLPGAFYDFARTSGPQAMGPQGNVPQYPMNLRMLLDDEALLECLGFDLAYDSQTAAHSLAFYWRALQPLPASLRLYPFYFDDDTGRILEDTTLRPMIATVWYPPEQWRVGETVVTRTMPWPIGATQGGEQAFSIGLGAVLGGNWEDVGRRLAIRVESSDLIARLFDSETWVRLLHVRSGEPVEEVRVFDLPSPQHPLKVDFGGQLRLLGYELDCDDRQASCHLELTWQAQERMDTSYTIFAQLLDPQGQVSAQVDSVPQGGGYPTVWWLPGEVVASSFTLELPTGAPRGVAYRLITGLYDPASGTRLLVAGAGADFVELQQVRFD
jgi:uncharacterized membrane protein